MHDWIEELGPGHLVLDLGAGAGSLKGFDYSCSVISADCDEHAFDQAYSGVRRVVASGDLLPFASAAFDLVLCHHVLEHVANLSETLAEISRVLKPTGRLYVAVPNGRGLCDGIYRYVFEGGDHVNRFDQQQLVATIERSVGVHLVARQNLYSSFAYLSRVRDLDRAILPQLPNRLRWFARVPRVIVLGIQSTLYLFTRFADRVAGVDWALYGWALYFAHTGQPAIITDNPPYVNVCLYCGSGIDANTLLRHYKFFYRCPVCDRRGLYFPPFRNCI